MEDYPASSDRRLILISDQDGIISESRDAVPSAHHSGTDVPPARPAALPSSIARSAVLRPPLSGGGNRGWGWLRLAFSGSNSGPIPDRGSGVRGLGRTQARSGPTRCIGLGARRLGAMLLETPPRPSKPPLTLRIPGSPAGRRGVLQGSIVRSYGLRCCEKKASISLQVPRAGRSR